jgi:hypothetical protein
MLANEFARLVEKAFFANPVEVDEKYSRIKIIGIPRF